MQNIAFDSHKRYTFATVEDQNGELLREGRIEHERGNIRKFLEGLDQGSPVAVETIGNWYWIIDEIEQEGMVPRLVHARKAKLMMGMINKTDKLDARGLNRLQRTGTLPTVWIAERGLRDKRELYRTRAAMGKMSTSLKNRLHSIFAKHGIPMDEVADIFSAKGRRLIESKKELLPTETRFCLDQCLSELDSLSTRIAELEKRIAIEFKETDDVRVLMTIPGVGRILAPLIAGETGDISRFAGADRYTSYCGTTPRVHSSGGKTYHGQLRSDVNHYLKWAFTEAANVIVRNRKSWPTRHGVRIYERIRAKKGHQVAVGALARHLADARYWMLTRKEPYRESSNERIPSKKG